MRVLLQITRSCSAIILAPAAEVNSKLLVLPQALVWRARGFNSFLVSMHSMPILNIDGDFKGNFRSRKFGDSLFLHDIILINSPFVEFPMSIKRDR